MLGSCGVKASAMMTLSTKLGAGRRGLSRYASFRPRTVIWKEVHVCNGSHKGKVLSPPLIIQIPVVHS